MSTTAHPVTAPKKESKAAQMACAGRTHGLGMAGSSVERMPGKGNMALPRIELRPLNRYRLKLASPCG